MVEEQDEFLPNCLEVYSYIPPQFQMNCIQMSLLLIALLWTGSPLLLVGCQPIQYVRTVCQGTLTVEPAPLFRMGTNLTVYCHTTCKSRSVSSVKLYLEVKNQSGARQEPEEIAATERSCTTARFRLVNVTRPKSSLFCYREMNGRRDFICGLDLQSGLPPDKPTEISCQTLRNSNLIYCFWTRGQETHLITTYNISVTSFNRENGTQIHYDGVQSTDIFSLPKTLFDENETYQLNITAANALGTSKSDPFILRVRDVVLPDVPEIKSVQIEIMNNSITATLHWENSSEHLMLHTRHRTVPMNGSWVLREQTELSKGLIRLRGLVPLTEYEFQIRVCKATPELIPALRPTSTPKPSKRPLCSTWSPPVRANSTAKGPLHVWRISGDKETNMLREVTILWKALSPEDYSGEVQRYDIFLDNRQRRPIRSCPANATHCSVPVSHEVQTLSVSAVTLYGESPPAAVHLRCSGVSGPALTELAPAGNGSAVVVTWSLLGAELQSGSGGELLGHVVEWRSGAEELCWQRVSKDVVTTLITSLTAGVRYNVSLYAVTTSGVSDPSTGMVYSKEERPRSGPVVSVLVHEARQILIQWEELAVDQLRGFLVNYSIYLRSPDTNHTEQHQKTVSGSEPRQRWLDCPEGALDLFMSASTSAGEGPPGNVISLQPVDPEVGWWLAGFVVTGALFMMLVANLMCWSCLRNRVKKMCISMGPAWLVENLPKLGNSNAIKLLKQEEPNTEPFWLAFTDSDPVVSPIEEVSQGEQEEQYPIVHTLGLRCGSGHAAVDGTLQETRDDGNMPSEGLLVHVDMGYKPQIITSDLQDIRRDEGNKEDKELSGVTAAYEQGEGCPELPGGLLGGRLSGVEADLSLGLTLDLMGGCLGPNTPRISSLLFREDRLGKSEAEMDTVCLDIQESETLLDETQSCLSESMTETTLTDGYFPQLATVSSTQCIEG